MRKQFALFLLLLMPLLAFAQGITVPKNVYFADVHLKISDRGQQEIQKKVDALHRNQTYFKIKVELADAYFPIIERVFKEENVPDDFKYLALQESGLLGDAVSTSNAVGYWQFKKEAASDFNLRINNIVDERRHIIEASRGAAKYFKRSNNYYDNWLLTLLSYLEGYSGAKAYAKASDKGTKKMDITEASHPYVLTFLAHKIAYDSFVGKNTPAVSLRELRATPGQSLADIALATKTDYPELERYNKWLLGSTIPSDKDYYVLVPVRKAGPVGDLLAANTTEVPARRINTATGMAAMVKRNGLSALVARPGDTRAQLASQAGISSRRFLKYNDMHDFDKIQEGTLYYVEPKKSSAETEFHVVQPGESMQQISQHYGVKLSHLQFNNRMSRSEIPAPGRVLWLQKRRPVATPVEVRELNKQQLATAGSYNTTAANTQTQVAATTVVEKQEPKGNIFTRFFNSLKGKKNNPETSPDPVAAAPIYQPVTTAPATPVAYNEEKVPAVTQAPEVPEASANTAQPPVTPEPVNVTPAKPAAIYPGKTPAAEVSTSQDAVSWPIRAPEKEAADMPMHGTETSLSPENETTNEATPLAGDNELSKTQAASTVPAAKAVAPPLHVVKQGETLYTISRMYAVTINDLNRWNNLGDEPLKIGQHIVLEEPLATQQTTAIPAETEAVPSNGVHTVAAGETLYQLAKKYGVTLAELRDWNHLANNTLGLGQELRVVAPETETAPDEDTSTTPEATEEAPVVTTSAPSSGYHTVLAGESMYQISRKYGITIKDIMAWNNKSDFAVSAGEKLLVKKK